MHRKPPIGKFRTQAIRVYPAGSQPQDDMTERTLIVSATNLLARGFLVVPVDRRSPTGEPVNGLFAVAQAVLHVIGWKVPARAVAIVDRGGRTWPALLAPQLEALPALLRALGLTVVEAPEEAHLVGSYTRAALAAGDDVVIAGTDKRYAQLVSDRVWWYDAHKDARYTPEIVFKRFGVQPERVGDWLALVGDDDQVPGVAGIGAKGATGLLTAHGSVEEALAQLPNLEGRVRKALEAAQSKLPQHLAHARLGDRPLPLPLSQAGFGAPAREALNAQLEALGFVELLISSAVGTQLTLCRTPDEFSAALQRLGTGTPSLYALLEEHEDGPETIHGVAISGGDGAAAYVEAGTPAWEPLLHWLEDPGAPKAGHDLVGTLVTLRRSGVQVAGVVSDSACASHLTQPSGWAPHELPSVARHVLGRSLATDEEVLGTGGQRKRWRELGSAAAQVAGDRADAAAAVGKRLTPQVDARLLAEYLQLSETLVRMELTGIAIDLAQLDRAETAFTRIEGELQGEIEALAGHTFNINSSPQLGKVLFEELGLPVVSRTKTGFSTSNEALERIEYAHPIVSRVLRWRLVRRLADSWVHPLRRCVHVDGRVHSRFYPARSFSGQIVSTRPDLARVPGRTPEMAEIRRAFVAPPGRLLMSVDFNQLGLHVLAHLTRDPALVDPLRQRADMHRLTAAAVLEKPADQITLDERQLGKVINFATFAGQGPSALALQLGVSAAQAKEYLARFDRRYAKVREFQDEQLRLAKSQGYIVTLAGRRWPIGGLESLDSQLRSYAERLARRGTHEGSVADVSRHALLLADQAIQKAGLSAAPLVEVVDEVLFEVAEAELSETAQLCATTMRHAFGLEVPLAVGVEAGRTWADLQPLELTGGR
ncbi:MAG: DNA polymerase [Myxococcota bacterium]|nr:DNA polymerase [Myxococcota bacterium]